MNKIRKLLNRTNSLSEKDSRKKKFSLDIHNSMKDIFIYSAILFVGSGIASYLISGSFFNVNYIGGPIVTFSLLLVIYLTRKYFGSSGE